MANMTLITAGLDRTIRLWETRNGFCYQSLQYGESQVNKLAITPNNKYLAAAGNPHIKLFDLTSSNQNAVSNFLAHKSNVTAVGFEQQGDFMYSGSEDGTIKIWDPRVPYFQREFVYTSACNTVQLHKNQRDLIAGHQSGAICVYDLRTGKRRLQFVVKDDHYVISLSISGDGRRCCASLNNGECYHWNLIPEGPEYFQDEKSWVAHHAYVLKVLFSPDMGSIATASSDTTIRIWDANDFSLQKVLKGHTRWVWDGLFSSDSKYIVSASSDNMARLWDIREEKSIIQFTGHHKAVVCMALNNTDYIPNTVQDSSFINNNANTSQVVQNSKLCPLSQEQPPQNSYKQQPCHPNQCSNDIPFVQTQEYAQVPVSHFRPPHELEILESPKINHNKLGGDGDNHQ